MTLQLIINRMVYLYGNNHFDRLGNDWRDTFLSTWRELYIDYRNNHSI
jgi:hypothetical protein